MLDYQRHQGGKLEVLGITSNSHDAILIQRQALKSYL